ncbi:MULTISPECIES: glucose 1-dehydrogenase [Streptacidiphilus]|uniref:Glucose 1-dehydrogenase n=1 Tax=Streptacidiphilus cavernicola TaxID=3342716 RepID=A0ABV6UPN5_9ACTN|nr:glucose 1-dehydrogenase [Streptacidiphilus jeojiense]
MARLDGKVAVITGGARGMGAEHARRFVAEGASVVISDVLKDDGAALADELGGKALFLAHDVTDGSRWDEVVREAEEAFGPVDVLVNNAGISSGSGLQGTDEEHFRRIIDVNQVSVFLGMKAVLPSMRRAAGGSIINVSSTSGLVGSQAFAYTASKFAVRGMTKAAAIELGPMGIRVNSVHPGYIRTPMITGLPDRLPAATPLGRAADPSEVSSLVLYLASDESSFSTGSEFVVDGGFTAQ